MKVYLVEQTSIISRNNLYPPIEKSTQSAYTNIFDSVSKVGNCIKSLIIGYPTHDVVIGNRQSEYLRGCLDTKLYNHGIICTSRRVFDYETYFDVAYDIFTARYKNTDSGERPVLLTDEDPEFIEIQNSVRQSEYVHEIDQSTCAYHKFPPVPGVVRFTVRNSKDLINALELLPNKSVIRLECPRNQLINTVPRLGNIFDLVDGATTILARTNFQDDTYVINVLDVQ